jgi:hypothetical protein
MTLEPCPPEKLTGAPDLSPVITLVAAVPLE